MDYKAAVRWIRHNKDKLPAGDTEKIISDGLSAGGALSSLLGATGNAKEYLPYLEEIGAAYERDDIFASAVYCPITDLEHADMPYEWIFNGVNTYHMGPAREMNEKMQSASEALKAAPAFDSLNMKSYENNEFEDAHFTEYSFKHSTAEKPKMVDAEKIYLMNPLNFIGKEGVNTAKHWRIRHGVKDRDTSLAVPAILALKLKQEGYNADVAAVWGVPHDGNYDIPELFEWIDSICK